MPFLDSDEDDKSRTSSSTNKRPLSSSSKQLLPQSPASSKEQKSSSTQHDHASSSAAGQLSSSIHDSSPFVEFYTRKNQPSGTQRGNASSSSHGNQLTQGSSPTSKQEKAPSSGLNRPYQPKLDFLGGIKSIAPATASTSSTSAAAHGHSAPYTAASSSSLQTAAAPSAPLTSLQDYVGNLNVLAKQAQIIAPIVLYSTMFRRDTDPAPTFIGLPTGPPSARLNTWLHLALEYQDQWRCSGRRRSIAHYRLHRRPNRRIFCRRHARSGQ